MSRAARTEWSGNEDDAFAGSNAARAHELDGLRLVPGIGSEPVSRSRAIRWQCLRSTVPSPYLCKVRLKPDTTSDPGTLIVRRRGSPILLTRSRRPRSTDAGDDEPASS